MLKKIVWVVLGILVSLSVAMIGLSELDEVVVIRSPIDGENRETRIWVIDSPDGLLVRGSDGKAWVEAARRAPSVELERNGVWRRYSVVEQTGAESRQRINDLMREKYGFADRMIGLMRDYDATVALLLIEVRSDERAGFASPAVAADPTPVEAPSISATELHRRIEVGEGPVVIDVRTPAEYAAGHMPGAVNIPFDQVAERISEVDAPNGVALYCMVGPRARKGEATLLAAGHESVFHLEGGLAAWQEAGFAVVPGD